MTLTTALHTITRTARTLGTITARDRTVCHLIGHDLSFHLAAQQGILNHPVCKRCGQTIR